MSGSSKKGFDAPPSSFPAFKTTSSGANKGNWVASSKVRVVTSTNTTSDKYYEIVYGSKPKRPRRLITRRIQIGDFKINDDIIDNKKSKINYEVYAHYVINQQFGDDEPSSSLFFEAFKVPKKYQKPAGEEFEEWRQSNGSRIAFARYCDRSDGRCSGFATNYDYTTKIKSFKSKLKKRGIDQYVNDLLGESLTKDFFVPPSLGELSDITITPKKKYTRKAADKITNFNPSTDTLDIDADSFGIDRSATFAAAQNKRKLKKLAKKDFDFLYDQKKGGLYFNENGADKGFGDGGIIAILDGAPELTSENIDFI